MSQTQDSGAGPLVIARQGHFHVGGAYAPELEGAPMVGQMYVEFQIPHDMRHPHPIVMVHGGQQTGTNWTGTPDGRDPREVTGGAPLRRGDMKLGVDVFLREI